MAKACNAGERWKTTVGLISKKATLQEQHTFFVHLFAVVLHDYNVTLPETSQLDILWRKCCTCSRSLFSTAAHFHLALLVAASISHFVTATTNFLIFESPSPFFSLTFAGLPPTFSFSLSFSCSIFQICGRDNLSKLNTLDNTDTEKISAFLFRLYWLFCCLCFTRHCWLCDFPPK